MTANFEREYMNSRGQDVVCVDLRLVHLTMKLLVYTSSAWKACGGVSKCLNAECSGGIR